MSLRVPQKRPITVGPPPSESKILPVPEITQEELNWCWAGCADMVLTYYGEAITQCALAAWLFQMPDCCSAPSSCDKPCQLSDVSRVYEQWEVQADFQCEAISAADLQSELDAGRPVAVAFQWTEGGAHIVIICGWEQDQTGLLFNVNDPDPAKGSSVHDYADLVSAFGLGTWRWTWTGIEKLAQD